MYCFFTIYDIYASLCGVAIDAPTLQIIADIGGALYRGGGTDTGDYVQAMVVQAERTASQAGLRPMPES